MHITFPCAGSWSLYRTLLFPVPGRGVYTLRYYSLRRVVKFILHITIPCLGRVVNVETLLESRSELRSDALPVATIDFSEIRTDDSLSTNHVF